MEIAFKEFVDVALTNCETEKEDVIRVVLQRNFDKVKECLDDSNEFISLLKNSISKVKGNSSHLFIYVYEINEFLKNANTISQNVPIPKCSRELNGNDTSTSCIPNNNVSLQLSHDDESKRKRRIPIVTLSNGKQECDQAKKQCISNQKSSSPSNEFNSNESQAKRKCISNEKSSNPSNEFNSNESQTKEKSISNKKSYSSSNEFDSHESQADLDKIVELENILSKLEALIVKYATTEVNSNENSAYVLQHKCMKKYIYIYNKIAKLGYADKKTNRIIKKRIMLRSTQFPDLNSKLSHKFSTQRDMPCYADVYDLVNDYFKKKNLVNIDVEKNAQMLFRELVKKMKYRRIKDFRQDFFDITDEPDPAAQHESLEETLQRYPQIDDSVDHVIDSFANKQEEYSDHTEEGSSDSSSDSESDDIVEKCLLKPSDLPHEKVKNEDLVELQVFANDVQSPVVVTIDSD